MLAEAVLALEMEFSFKPKIDQLELMKSRFHYDWWEEPIRPIEDGNEESTERLFKKLLETMEKQPLEPFNKIQERFGSRLV
jgi:hypothetical protein